MIPTTKVCLRIHPGHIPTTVLIKVSLTGDGVYSLFGFLCQEFSESQSIDTKRAVFNLSATGGVCLKGFLCPD